MYERIGVHELESGRGAFDALRSIGDRMRSRDRQNGPDSFAASEQAVTHGAMDRRRINRFGRHPVVENLVYCPNLSDKKILQRRGLFSGLGHFAGLSGLNGTAAISAPRLTKISTRDSACSS